MKLERGNEKLGVRVATISREIGPTCPQDCHFLDNGCYAQRVPAAQQRRWRENNLVRSVEAAKKRLARWKREGKLRALRLHVGGDFLWEGKLDERYCALVEDLLRDVDVPAWVYTHAWRDLGDWLWRFKRAGMEVFASVHTPEDAHAAVCKGFRLAYCSTDKKEGYAGPKAVRVGGECTAVCPEQIGTKENCESCGLCFSDTTEVGVTFLEH